MPRSFMYTRQFAILRSMPTSVEKSPLILENELGKHDVYYRRNARGAEGGVFNTLIPQFFRDNLSRFLARSQKTLGGKLRPSWWACVGRREGRNVLRPWRGGAGRLRVLQPVNTEYVIVFQGWRATSGRVRRAISLRNAPTGNPVHRPNHGGNVTGTCGRGRRPRRPAPGAGRPAVRPGAWGRAGARDARPYQRRGPHAPRPTCWGGVGGVGTAATSAALPHGTARFHFGTHVFPHPATRCCKMRFHRVIILKAVVPRGGFDTCGLPRGCLGGPGAARSGCVPGSCPSRACRDLHSRAPPSSPENRDKSILNTRRPPPGRTRINVLVFPVGARVPQSCQASLMHDANSAVPSPHTISGLHQIGSSWPVRHLQLA